MATRRGMNRNTRAANAASVASPTARVPMAKLQQIQRRTVRSPLPTFHGPVHQTVMNRPLGTSLSPSAVAIPGPAHPRAAIPQRVTTGIRTATGAILRRTTASVLTPNQVTTAVTGNVGHNAQAALRNFVKNPVVTVRRAIGK